MCFRPGDISIPKKCEKCGCMNEPEDVTCKRCGADLPESTFGVQPAVPGAPSAPPAPNAPGESNK